ncbi:nucleosidase [Parapedobacter sp. 2B3]|uniref:5'-methylthioadenosine/S-adenosylhomocysteine nucleosidase family protein n=1 Tax=Parapedobacter sp. 2B3 TaxID=3342381 RepID=UPI0035B6AB74
MLTINQDHVFPFDGVLFTFALASEAAEVFKEYNHLICGIGKVNATYHLLKAIQREKPALIVNLGSAGSNHFQRGEVVCCTKFIQRDMNVMALGFEQYETPLSGLPPILGYGLSMDGLQEGICGTGDNFEMAHAATCYNVVDMEAYALAMVAMKEEVPFLCLKYISDGADGNAAEEWMVQVHKAAVAFGDVLGFDSSDIPV